MFGLKHDRHSSTTIFGLHDVTNLSHMGTVSSEADIKWADVVLKPGEYSLYADNFNSMYAIPKA